MYVCDVGLFVCLRTKEKKKKEMCVYVIEKKEIGDVWMERKKDIFGGICVLDGKERKKRIGCVCEIFNGERKKKKNVKRLPVRGRLFYVFFVTLWFFV